MRGVNSTFFTDRDLARNFVKCIGRIEKFLETRHSPFIGNPYRPTPQEIIRRPAAPRRGSRSSEPLTRIAALGPSAMLALSEAAWFEAEPRRSR